MNEDEGPRPSGSATDQGPAAAKVWDELKSNYAQHLASSVDLPQWAAKKFTAEGLAVLGEM